MLKTLGDMLEASVLEAEHRLRTTPSIYDGSDWWQLSEHEEYAFSIDRDRWPRMTEAWELFLLFIGEVTGYTSEDLDAAIDRERVKRPDLFKAGNTLKNFTDFARDYAQLKAREAEAAYTKMHFHDIAQGHIRYPDERRQ